MLLKHAHYNEEIARATYDATRMTYIAVAGMSCDCDVGRAVARRRHNEVSRMTPSWLPAMLTMVFEEANTRVIDC